MKTKLPTKLHLTVLAVLSIGIFSCDLKMKDASDFGSSEEQEQDSITGGSRQQLPLLINYSLDSITSVGQLDSLKAFYTKSDLELLWTLNRIDARYVGVGDRLIVPDTLTGNILDYSPFPHSLEMLEKIPKTVLISRRIQAFALYEGTELIHWGAVSSGKKSTPTPAGLFYGNYKARSKVSTVDDSWILPYYFNFLNFDGVGVHEYAMPGYPASHACVRLFQKDAIKIYNWAEQWRLDTRGQQVVKNGTPFMVFGEYDFDGPLPWIELAQRPNSNFLSSEEMQILRSYVSEYWEDERNKMLNEGKEAFAVTSQEELQTVN